MNAENPNHSGFIIGTTHDDIRSGAESWLLHLIWDSRNYFDVLTVFERLLDKSTPRLRRLKKKIPYVFKRDSQRYFPSNIMKFQEKSTEPTLGDVVTDLQWFPLTILIIDGKWLDSCDFQYLTSKMPYSQKHPLTFCHSNSFQRAIQVELFWVSESISHINSIDTKFAT